MRYLGIVLIIFVSSIAQAQDIFLAAYKKMPSGLTGEIERISFNQNSETIAVTDTKGALSILELETSNILKKESLSGKILFHEFIGKDNKLLLVKANGDFFTYSTPSYERSKGSQSFASPLFVTLDPNEGYLTVLTKSNELEIFDLRANMMQAQIQAMGTTKNTLFLGFDRFGQQLATINSVGETYNWELMTQRFLRQLTLQSGEFVGSRSVVHAAATSQGADHFVIGLQEVFIPKGGLQPGRQPERRNMIIAYDWATGQEKKRVPLRYRPDGMGIGPTPSTIIYFSKDTDNILIVNLDKGEVRESVVVEARPSAIALSDDGEILAVGTLKGEIYLFEVVRNNPAEIRVLNPTINRNIGEQVVQTSTITLEGKIESTERFNQVTINGEKAVLKFDGSFSGVVNLVPGKNRIRIDAQNTQSQVITKDIYFTSAPQTAAPSSVSSSEFTKRIALVVGNGDYKSEGKLRNTLNDAQAMTATLKRLGFEVMTVENGTYEEMKNAVYAFGDQIQDVDVSMFFYAGHGIEVDGVNYLIPVDADVQSHLDVKQKCIPLTGILNTMEFANDEGLNMIILDACRNNPFPTGKRGGAGLARVSAPSGTLIAYATDPGSVASDGDGANGLYTGELVKQLNISQRIEDIFMNTRNSVEQLSGGKQRPWEEARLKGVFYLK